MIRRFVFIMTTLIATNLSNAQQNIGHWEKDSKALPCFDYTGKVPYNATLANGTKVKLPQDPFFLLGNYQFKVFAHVSGEYEMLTGQRAWGRLNQGDKPNSGLNGATLQVLDKNGKSKNSFSLTGMNSLAADPSKCRRVFGCGFAHYTYEVPGIGVERVLSVKPSTNPYNGTSAFLLTVTIKNQGRKDIELAYEESITANYETIQQQHQDKKSKKVSYSNTVFNDAGKNIIGVHTKGVSADPLLITTKDALSKYEGFPPSLFIKAVSQGVTLTEDHSKLAAIYRFTLKPGEEKTMQLIIGYSLEESIKSIEEIAGQLTPKPVQKKKEKGGVQGGAFTNEWLTVLPKFDTEKDRQFGQELVWHAYVLEAMATYSGFYKETKVPQGTIYDFDWGVHASARDNFQHALPLLYYNPALAKSVLRYMLKRTTSWGEIRLIEMGNGFADASSYTTSDQQLYFFYLLSEYLKVTKDYAFLKEELPYYPMAEGAKGTVLDFVQKCFGYLKEEVGTGSHGLVRLLNSDWNDAIYYVVNAPYNRVLYTGESHMNTAMALAVFQSLVPALNTASQQSSLTAQSGQLKLIADGMQLYRKGLLDAFMKDLGDRSFPKRMYFNGKAYGEDNMFLEPQGFTLMIDELPLNRKRALYEEMKKRIYAGEKLGARQQQTPEFEDDGFDKGSRENGGFWYSLNGPVIIGVSQFDKKEAEQLLHNMTFDNYAKEFPQYWSSYWSASDNVESSLIPMEGLPDQTDNYADQPIYCAHPHAWILYCYYKLKTD